MRCRLAEVARNDRGVLVTLEPLSAMSHSLQAAPIKVYVGPEWADARIGSYVDVHVELVVKP